MGAGDDGYALLVGLFIRGQNLADTGAVNGDGLLGKKVFAGLDGGLDVLRPEARWGCQHDQVAAIDHFLIRVKANERAIVGDIEFLFAELMISQPLAAIL